MSLFKKFFGSKKENTSQSEPTKLKREPFKVTAENKLSFLDQFLQTEDIEWLEESLYEDYDTVMVIDWKGEDEDTVYCCKEILGLDDLSSEVIDADNELGYDMFIQFEEQRERLPFTPDCAFRDITLKTLNRLIAPNYEIRWCLFSDDSDTLVFLPLTQEQWAFLDNKHGEKVDAHFAKINAQSVMFGN